MMQAKTDEYYQLNDNMDGKELLPLFVKTTYIYGKITTITNFHLVVKEK